MIRDNETTTYESLAGSSNLVKDCEHQASLVVRFKEAEEEKSVVVLSKTVPRGTNATEEKLFVDDDDVLQKILDPCLSTPSIKLVPINNELQSSIPFEEPTNMSDIAWEGCLDYNVVATRSEEGQSPQICTVRHCVTSKNQMSDPLSYREINKSLSFKCTKGQRNHCGHPLRAHMHRQEFFEF